MNKSILSALGLAVAIAFSMPVLGNAATTTTAPAATTTAPAATTTAPATAAPAAKAAPMKKAVKACKPTKKHKCPVKKAPMKAAPKKMAPKKP